MRDSTSENRTDLHPEPAQYIEAEHGVGQGADQPDCAAGLHEQGEIRGAARDDTGKSQRMTSDV